jgi:DNA topoisomerase III
MMKLFIAEKPSLGMSITKALPGNGTRGDGFVINKKDGWTVTWAIGHLLEQLDPGEYRNEWKKWRRITLPMIPDEWKSEPKAKTQKQFNMIKQLLGSCQSVVNAGDPDCEGSLIVDEVLEYLGYEGEVERIWLTDLTVGGIKKALENMVPNQKMVGYSDAAKARSRADWLLGMNLSRAYSLRRTAVDRANGISFEVTKKRGVISIGRVQTPTLAMIVKRDMEIDRFKPETYYTLDVIFQHANGEYPASWVVGKKKCLDQEKINALAKALKAANSGVVTQFSGKRKKLPPPLPFDLASLQVACSSKFKMGAKETLETVQSLYEQHKMVTYPRTDCRYLNDSQHSEAPLTLQSIANAGFADEVLLADATVKNKAFNSKIVKKHAHTAITPTAKVNANSYELSAREKQVYELVVKQYLAQFYPLCVQDDCKVTTQAVDADFSSSGKVTIERGWKALLSNPAKEKDVVIPAMSKGDSVTVAKTTVKKKQTKPPAKYTEGLLITAMGNVAKLFPVGSEYRKALSEADGIGTAATQANIIDTLKKRDFIITEKKSGHLTATVKGSEVISCGIRELNNPAVTAQWEKKLRAIERGDFSLHSFQREVEGWVGGLVNQVDTLVFPVDKPAEDDVRSHKKSA